MAALSSDSNRGFTLVELLIVLAILTLLLQLTLPAVQKSRESARRLHCAENMRQLGQAIQGFEAVHDALPPGYSLKPRRHNFVQFLLPYIERQSVYGKYSFDRNWNNSMNSEAVNTEIELLRCPSAPEVYKFTADFGIYERVHPDLLRMLVAESVVPSSIDTSGALTDRPRRSTTIVDGRSQTIFLCEVAGRPDKYVLGERVGQGFITGSRWATPAGRFDLRYHCRNKHSIAGSQYTNCTNKNEIYSFHPEGCNYLFGDGSVRFMDEQIGPATLIGMLTARGEEVW